MRMMEKKIFDDDDDDDNDGLGVVGVYDAYSGGFVCIFCFVVSLVSV
jgi:hypothetical protein